MARARLFQEELLPNCTNLPSWLWFGRLKARSSAELNLHKHGLSPTTTVELSAQSPAAGHARRPLRLLLLSRFNNIGPCPAVAHLTDYQSGPVLLVRSGQ